MDFMIKTHIDFLLLGAYKWSTRAVSTAGRSRNKQGKCLRSHFAEIKVKGNKMLAQ